MGYNTWTKSFQGEIDSARVNLIDWDRVEELQEMQSQDLLKKVMNQGERSRR